MPRTDDLDDDWWRDAVVYQIYPRSFRDGDGDGIGDLAGIRRGLTYLADLGVDAIWISPWYPSPMVDAGYDVADHRDVDPVFGSLAEAEELVAAAHRLRLRVLLDLVPNHTSDRHPWFTHALRAAPGSPERDRYIFRNGTGYRGDQPPNNWRSSFGGPAWTRTADDDGQPGQWYLHLFAPEQPDLNWDSPEVRADFDATLRFWFDRGVDGFRIDVAHGLAKAPGLPNVDAGAASRPGYDHPHRDRDDAQRIFRRWREIGDGYAPRRVFVAEAWVSGQERLTRYLRPGVLHTAFNFDYLTAPWRADHLRAVIDAALAAHDAVGAPVTWLLSNHDVPRHLSRYAREQPDRPVRSFEEMQPGPPDLAAGTRRARGAALLMLALPGDVYLYQGEELGLPEVEDLPPAVRQDPVALRGRQRRGEDADGDSAAVGRDGCRVPLPWAGEVPPYGFGPDDGAAPWLPQPASWAPLSVAAQTGRPGSTLELYRQALRRRRSAVPRGSGLRWLDAPDGVLAFGRGDNFRCLVNLSADRVPLPTDIPVALTSGDLAADGGLPPDTAAWLARSRGG